MSQEQNGPVEAAALSQMGSTFAERAAAAKKATPTKAVQADEVEDKAVTKATKKRGSASK